ncbi:MAG: ECF transporter S component [Eubacteriales bacterium]|nr:ECF transporter S component [Eubacteriales bacterium]
MNTKTISPVKKITLIGMMAAVVCVVTLFRFPLFGSKVHFANTMCLLAGLLLGPVSGGLAAGLGSAIYDVLLGGYGAIEAVVTFVNKFAMAWVCAMLVHGAKERGALRVILACVAGAFTYMALYLFKTWIFQQFVYGFAPDVVWATLLSKVPASLINACLASVAGPVLYGALTPSLKKMGLPW